MIILHIFTGLNDGGAEGVLYRLCKYDREYTHVVISMLDKGKYGPLLEKEGVKVHCLNLSVGKITLSALFRLYNLIIQISPDIVQTWMYHADFVGGILSRLAGVKHVFWNVRHTTLEPGKSKCSTILVAKACAFVSGWVPKKIVYCAYEARTVHEALGYKKGKDEVISNGYDLSHFRVSESERCAFRTEMKLSDDINLIGMVGRYDPQKDHASLIKSLAMVKKAGYSFKLALIGRDLNSHNDLIVEYIYVNQLTDDIELLDQRTDIHSVMNGIDINVLSSSYGEGFPNVLAEAMACGTPCVTTDVGDAAYIVGETGWVVPPNEPESLSSAIIKALKEKKNNEQVWLERKRICRNRIYENFSVLKMINSYKKVWLIKE